jgi:hypothetical protein
MRRASSAACLALLLCGCDPIPATTWKNKYLKEIEYHHQTQQIKNAEIAARDMEVENQRAFMAVLTERINQLEKEKEALRDQLNQPLHENKSERRGPATECVGKVTAVVRRCTRTRASVGGRRRSAWAR